MNSTEYSISGEYDIYPFKPLHSERCQRRLSISNRGDLKIEGKINNLQKQWNHIKSSLSHYSNKHHLHQPPQSTYCTIYDIIDTEDESHSVHIIPIIPTIQNKFINPSASLKNKIVSHTLSTHPSIKALEPVNKYIQRLAINMAYKICHKSKANKKPNSNKPHECLLYQKIYSHRYPKFSMAIKRNCVINK